MLARLEKELATAGETDIEVKMNGVALDAAGRRTAVAPTPIGPGGGPAVRSVRMVLPSSEDMRTWLQARREANVRLESPEKIAEVLEKYLKEKVVGKGHDHVALLAAWGPKAVPDAEGEFAEVAALMAMQLRAYKAGIQSAKEDFQFEVHRAGDGKECLVMPPSNFALLGLKDAFHMLLQGFRVVCVVQPRFLPHFLEVRDDMVECGLPEAMFEVVPGITPEADPEVLHEALKVVDRLQFTGSSAMFKALVAKAIDLGNLRMEHAGEVSGLNKVRLDGVSIDHPAAAAGTAWAAMANNGELCTSASLVEFDPATGDSADKVKAKLEAHNFRLGTDPYDTGLDVLLREGKAKDLSVKTDATGFQEWWEKTILAAPQGGAPHLKTNQSLGHCIYSPSIRRALSLGVQEHASCLYMVGVPADASSPSARAGTTGAKLPQSVFGGMKTNTFAVAGDHDGVGSVQTLLNTLRRRSPSWRDQEEARAEYELTETAEELMEFLDGREHKAFTQQLSNMLEIFTAFQPEVSDPYPGQSLVGASGSSQLVTLAALRPARKNLLIPRGIGLSEDIVKAALLCEMSPLREVPVNLHLVGAAQSGKLRVTDPLKSFLRMVENRLGWKVQWHNEYEDLSAAVRQSEFPPYFFCIKDKHVLPVDFLQAVNSQGGYLYEGLPTDALSLFRWMTCTQAWTVSCTESQVAEATAELNKSWETAGLRAEPHPAPEVVQPPKRAQTGGLFGDAGGLSPDDKSWDDLSDDSDSDEEAAAKEKKP